MGWGWWWREGRGRIVGFDLILSSGFWTGCLNLSDFGFWIFSCDNSDRIRSKIIIGFSDPLSRLAPIY